MEASANFPDGTQIFTKSITSLQILSGAPTILNVGLVGNLTTFPYTAVDAGSALRIKEQINGIINGVQSGEVEIIDVATPAVSSITVAPAVGLDNNTIRIFGTSLSRASYLIFSTDETNTQWPFVAVTDSEIQTDAIVTIPTTDSVVNIYDSDGRFIASIALAASSGCPSGYYFEPLANACVPVADPCPGSYLRFFGTFDTARITPFLAVVVTGPNDPALNPGSPDVTNISEHEFCINVGGLTPGSGTYYVWYDDTYPNPDSAIGTFDF